MFYKEMKNENNLIKAYKLLAEIEAIIDNVDSKYIDKKGAFDIQKCDLISYANGGYYTQGKKIGKFGYSVKNNKK